MTPQASIWGHVIIWVIVLGAAFVVLKVSGYIDWSWWWVLSPFWVLVIIIVLIIGLFGALMRHK